MNTQVVALGTGRAAGPEEGQVWGWGRDESGVLAERVLEEMKFEPILVKVSALTR